MDLAFMNKIAKKENISLSDVYLAVAKKRIAWDNCEGRIVTMARANEIVYVTKHDETIVAHFDDGGDVIISDFVEQDEIRLVTQ